jgi:hypothetical protein
MASWFDPGCVYGRIPLDSPLDLAAGQCVGLCIHSNDVHGSPFVSLPTFGPKKRKLLVLLAKVLKISEVCRSGDPDGEKPGRHRQ